MSLEFEWDEDKAWRNLLKHRISFEEAITVFADPMALTVFDEAHSTQELRFKTTGLSERIRVLLIVHAERGDRIRLISARRASAKERQAYETQND